MMNAKTLRHLLAIAVVAGTVALAAPSASALVIARSDGNDTPGPLDLASVRATPIESGTRIQVRTLTKFTAAQLDGDDGWIEVDFDTNADKTVNYWVVVLYHKGKLYAIEGRGSNALRQLPVHRSDPKTVSFDIRHRYLGSITNFRFYAASIWRAAPCSHKKVCVDVIPNRYPLLLRDFTAPSIHWKNVPKYSTDVSATLTFPVKFTVHDDQHGSGLDHWLLERRIAGGSFTNVKHGTSSTPTVAVTGVQGAAYDLRVFAVDRQGNKRTSSRKHVNVPFDDRNVQLVYSNGVQATPAGSFLNTVTTLAQNETMTFTFTFSGTSTSVFCVVLGPPVTGTAPTADLTVDGTPSGSADESSVSTRDTGLCVTPGAGSHTMVVKSTSTDPFVIDGVIAE